MRISFFSLVLIILASMIAGMNALVFFNYKAAGQSTLQPTIILFVMGLIVLFVLINQGVQNRKRRINKEIANIGNTSTTPTLPAEEVEEDDNEV